MRGDEKRAALWGPPSLNQLFRALFDLARTLLAIAFSSERLFLADFLTWFQIEGVTFDLLHNIFLLYFPLEAAQSTLQGFTILEMDFCQFDSPPSG